MSWKACWPCSNPWESGVGKRMIGCGMTPSQKQQTCGTAWHERECFHFYNQNIQVVKTTAADSVLQGHHPKQPKRAIWILHAKPAYPWRGGGCIGNNKLHEMDGWTRLFYLRGSEETATEVFLDEGRHSGIRTTITSSLGSADSVSFSRASSR